MGMELWKVWFCKVLHLSCMTWHGHEMVMLHVKQHMPKHNEGLLETWVLRWFWLYPWKIANTVLTQTRHFLQESCLFQIFFKECLFFCLAFENRHHCDLYTRISIPAVNSALNCYTRCHTHVATHTHIYIYICRYLCIYMRNLNICI